MSKHRSLRLTLGTALAAVALTAGGLTAGAEPAEAGLSSVPRWQDGSVGATIGCSLARTYISDGLCGGFLGFPM